MVIGGISLLVIGILALKNDPSSVPLTGVLPEQQLQRVLADGEPAVVFFHSLDCDSCVQMMEVVGQVHPEFADSVALVDVNVSDTRNHSLLRAQGIRAIPSLVYYDRFGQAEISYGVISPEQLRQQLQALSEK